MAASDKDLARLEADFLSGRNARAYLPLCTALRRQRRFARALELCQKGLSADSGSVAGRTLLARLLADLGRYDESLQEIARGEALDPAATGLQIEKARCFLRLHMMEEARELIDELVALHPIDPQIKMLATEMRQMTSGGGGRETRHSGMVRMISTQAEDILPLIQAQVAPLGAVKSAAIVDLDSDKTVVEGEESVVPLLEEHYGELSEACAELDQGTTHFLMIELEKALLLVFRRDRRLAILAMEPGVNFGKLMHRLAAVLNQHLPVAARAPQDDQEAEIL